MGNGDNGNVMAIANYRDTTRSQTFTYDQLNRVTSAQNAGTNCSQTTPSGALEYWGNTYTYDAWGNLLNKAVNKCNAEHLTGTADSQNRIHATSGADYQYDAAGNMTVNVAGPLAPQSFTYDAENRITGAGGFNYTYDADGNRVEKSNGETGTVYWYMTPGIVAESDLSGNLKSEYVFFDGERVARKDFSGSTTSVSYYFSDHLKTASVITNTAGIITEDEDYYPWGGEIPFVNGDTNHYKFTGKERDAETGLDYFGARYYGNWTGRFLSADWAAKPEAVPYSDLHDPQSLNLYSYVRNIPTSKADADGHCPPCDTDVEVNMEMVKQTLQQLGPAAVPALVAAGPAAAIAAPSVAGIGLAAAGPKIAPPDQEGGCLCPDNDVFFIVVPASGGNGSKDGGTNRTATSPGPDGMKDGSSNPDGAGKPFNESTKDGARAESGDRCVFCGRQTTREPGPDQSNVDHADAKSRGGDNSSNNAQNTCRTCNQDKGTTNNDEYLKYRQDNPQKYNHEPVSN